MLPLRLLMMPPPLMMPLAHLWAHLLTLTVDDDSAGRLFSVHADARAEQRHHTYGKFLDLSSKSTVPKTNQWPKKKLGPLLKPREGCSRGVSGARGPELILSVVESPKSGNGIIESSIFHWFYKLFLPLREGGANSFPREFFANDPGALFRNEAAKQLHLQFIHKVFDVIFSHSTKGICIPQWKHL